MGVTSVIDLILDQANKLNESEARHKLDNELVGFSQDAEDKVKKAKEQKYLTIKGLLDHPYFIEITETDISKVIEEFEKFENYRN
jgi:peroxiredoxin